MPSGSGTSVKGRQLIATFTTTEVSAIVWVFPASGLTDGIVKNYGYMSLEPRAGTPLRRYVIAGASLWTNGRNLRLPFALSGTELWMNWRESGIPYAWLTG